MAEQGKPEKGKLTGNINSLFSRYTGKEKLEEEISRLNSRIAELEAEAGILQKRMDKCAESEKRAVAAKQAAEESLNAAEVRIVTLEHELESHKGSAPSQAGYRLVETLSLRRAKDHLQSLSSLRSSSADLLTAYMPPGRSLSGEAYRDMPAALIDPEALQLIQRTDSSTGWVLFYDPGHLVNELLVPPFQVGHAEWSAGSSFNVEPLLKLIEREEAALVIVAHAGESLVAYSRDSGETDFYELVRSNVKSKHSKGGFSQRRFERLRDEEVVHHAEKARAALIKLLGSLQVAPDYFLLGGDEQLAKAISSGVAEDTPRLVSSADVRIEKHNINEIMKQMLVLRRYKL
ncbi:Vms1/Ankzf1 family peptidyl-tRNA hydrolase [Methanolobus chelungpuianus]|uniref:Actinobacteria/chloroflexi VLRF1 release factor domain-containing protein n=1 Tax=Methanolobus chelungpuianus TaxID=502115 RepID=A0AAE3H8W8_9EURY|nr:Vms1/Ankzf1 family peptidyl-tRNA hydrolase [Methanolobus chelungpuianus]MCQ6962130.1 hypothetical protein [Methanolobus chelungpuianus]